MEEERQDFAKIFGEVCLNQAPAMDFCHAFLAWVHFIDDMIDGDKAAPTPDDIIRINLELAMTFAFNPFWTEHKAKLIPLVIQGAQAFADSVDWALRPNTRDRLASDILKSQYGEVFWHVAFICGGLDHLEAVTKKYRQFNYDIVVA